MEMQNLEQSQNALRRLNAAIDELITLVRNQRRQIADAINAQEQSLSLNEAKIAALEAQIKTLSDDNAKLQVGVNAVAESGESSEKIQELQNTLDARNNKINGLQTEVQNLNTALSNRKMQIEDLESKNSNLTQKLTEMQQTITQTTESIDDVVARLEKVLEENGASDDNN